MCKTEVKPMAAKFLPIPEAAEYLGFVNARRLRNAINSGVLRIGIEVHNRAPSESKRPTYFVDLAAAEKRLMTPPEKRKPERRKYR